MRNSARFESGAVQKLESNEKLGKTTQNIATKNCAIVGRARRKREKLLSTSAKHDSSPQARRGKRGNKRAVQKQANIVLLDVEKHVIKCVLVIIYFCKIGFDTAENEFRQVCCYG